MPWSSFRYALPFALIVWALLLLPFYAWSASPVCGSSALGVSVASGKAPLMVFFDATASGPGNGCTDADTSKPVHHLTYCFDAGDGGTRTYNASGKTTQAATFCGAPIFVYVYETPGTYTATVTAIDEDGQSASDDIVITVNDWVAADTECVSTSGTFTNCPYTTGEGATHTTSSDYDAAISAAFAAGRERVLFRCGESFAVSTEVSIGVAGGGGGRYVGGYGSADCQYTVTGDPGSRFWDLDGDDVRIADGIWTGTQNSGTKFVEGHSVDGDNDSDNVLVDNWSLTDTGRVYDVADSTAPLPRYFGLFNTTAVDCGWAPGAGGTQQCWLTEQYGMAIVNSALDGNGSETTHVVRLASSEKCFIHNNKLIDPGTNATVMTLRALDWGGRQSISNRWSEHCMVSDNWFVINLTSEVELGSRNATPDEARHRDHVYERNYHTYNGANTGAHVTPRDSADGDAFVVHNDLTIRNNIFNLNGGGTNAAAISGSVDDGFEVYNNSAYGTTANFFWKNGQTAPCDVGANNVTWENGDDGATVTFNGFSCSTQAGNADTNGGETGVADLSACPFATCPPVGDDVTDYKPAGSGAGLEIDNDGVTTTSALATACDVNQEDQDLSTPSIGAWATAGTTNTCKMQAMTSGVILLIP